MVSHGLLGGLQESCVFFVSVCLAGVMVSGCCWLALVRRNRSLTVSFLQFFGFASGCTISSVFFQVQSLRFFQVQSLRFFQVQSLRFFQVRSLWVFSG